jgi:hypothetical protein
MFMYWSAPPSLLRIWACPKDPFPVIDGRFRFGSPAVQAGNECGSRLIRIGCYGGPSSSPTLRPPGYRLAEPGLSQAERGGSIQRARGWLSPFRPEKRAKPG